MVYDAYTTIDVLPNAEGCTGMQGMALDGQYLYSVKVNADYTAGVIYRTDRATGKSVLLKNLDSETDSVVTDKVSHANSMCLVNVDGVAYLYIATMEASDRGLVCLRLEEDGYTFVGSYGLMLSGKLTSASAAYLYGQEGTLLTFLFKRGANFYTGTFDMAQPAGQVELTPAFKLNVKAVRFGTQVCDLSSWSYQAFDYHEGYLFVVLWDNATSVTSAVAVFDIQKATGTITPDPMLSFRLTDAEYSLFEIEACALCPDTGRLYFNTNRSNNKDGIHYVNEYIFSKE